MLIEGLRWWEMGRKGEMVEEEEEEEGSRQSETEMLKEEGGGGAYFVDVIAVEAISSVCVFVCKLFNIPYPHISCTLSFITVSSGAPGGGKGGVQHRSGLPDYNLQEREPENQRSRTQNLLTGANPKTLRMIDIAWFCSPKYENVIKDGRGNGGSLTSHTCRPELK